MTIDQIVTHSQHLEIPRPVQSTPNITFETTVNGTISRATKKRSLDNLPRSGDEHEEPEKRPHCSKSPSSRVTDWLSQVPPGDPAATYTGPEDPALGSPAPLTGRVPSSRPYIETTPSSASSGRQFENPGYQFLNLQSNKINNLRHDESIWECNTLVCDSTTGRCAWPELTPEEAGKQMAYLRRLQHNGASTHTVYNWFSMNIKPPLLDLIDLGLMVQFKDRLKAECVPGPATGDCKISRPRPAFSFGYETFDGDTPFSQTQLDAFGKLKPRMGWVG